MQIMEALEVLNIIVQMGGGGGLKDNILNLVVLYVKCVTLLIELRFLHTGPRTLRHPTPRYSNILLGPFYIISDFCTTTLITIN